MPLKDARPVWPVRMRNSAPGGEVSADFERECVDFFAELAQALSVPRSLGQIYGVLFASPIPLSFTDIVERLDISKGSASQGLQLLRSLGAVRRADGKGGLKHGGDSRREQFVPELGLRPLIGGVLREKIEPVLGAGGTRMRRLRESARQAPSTPGVKFSLERVKQLETWRRQLGLLLPLVKTFFGFGPGLNH
jgi:DNA-binding transcriptional regulator GbsR (MarR family)